MSLFFRPQPETRSISRDDVWGAGGDAGSPLDSAGLNGALRLVPVYAAVSMICDLVSTAGLDAFRRADDGSRTLMRSQPQLVTKPGPYGSLIDWLHQCLASLLLRGNAYGYITAIDAAGRPSQVIWLHPDHVSVIEEQNDWFHSPRYYWRGRRLDNSLVLHIPAFTFPGSVVGLSPLALFKLTIETGMRAQQFGDDWFANGATPSGILKNAEKAVPQAIAAKAKARFKASVANRDPFVTGADWDYKALAVPANESQFLETIKANATQIAAIYRVSPEDIGGEAGKSQTYKTLESDNTKLTGRTLRVWARRVDTVLTDRLPSAREYVAFDLDELSHGDQTTQLAAQAAALNAGLDTLAEARAARNKPPLTDAEIEQWQRWFRQSKPSVDAPTPSADPPGGTS